MYIIIHLKKKKKKKKSAWTRASGLPEGQAAPRVQVLMGKAKSMVDAGRSSPQRTEKTLLEDNPGSTA